MPKKYALFNVEFQRDDKAFTSIDWSRGPIEIAIENFVEKVIADVWEEAYEAGKDVGRDEMRNELSA